MVPVHPSMAKADDAIWRQQQGGFLPGQVSIVAQNLESERAIQGFVTAGDFNTESHEDVEGRDSMSTTDRDLDRAGRLMITSTPFNAETPLEALREPITPTSLRYVRSNFDL